MHKIIIFLTFIVSMISIGCSKKEVNNKIVCSGQVKKYSELGFEILIPKNIKSKLFRRKIHNAKGEISYRVLSMKPTGSSLFINIKTRIYPENEDSNNRIKQAVLNVKKITRGEVKEKKNISDKTKNKGVYLKIVDKQNLNSIIHEIRIFARGNSTYIIDVFANKPEMDKNSKIIYCLNHSFALL